MVVSKSLVIGDSDGTEEREGIRGVGQVLSLVTKDAGFITNLDKRRRVGGSRSIMRERTK